MQSTAVESESRSRSRKDFEPEESESQKILTTPTRGWPFARRLWLFVPQMFASVTLGNLSSLTFQQKMIMAIQKGCSTLPTLRGDSRSAATRGGARHFLWGATGGASFATRGAINGLCRTFRKRPEKCWGGHWGGQANFLGGSGLPWHPPSSAPGSNTRAHHATYAKWVQPFEVCVTGISIWFHSGWHYRCSVTLVTQQWTSKKFSWELHRYASHVTEQW